VVVKWKLWHKPTQGKIKSFFRGNRKTFCYKQWRKIENFLAKLKDWRSIATRYDRCAHTFFSFTLSSPQFASPALFSFI
jgi:transposase